MVRCEKILKVARRGYASRSSPGPNAIRLSLFRSANGAQLATTSGGSIITNQPAGTPRLFMKLGYVTTRASHWSVFRDNPRWKPREYLLREPART